MFMSKKQKIESDTVVAQIKELVSSNLDGETVLMSVENGKYYGMDGIGSRIWELVASPRSISDVCNILIEEFEVDREKCERDVLDFLEDLRKQKLIKVINEKT
ncbi:MAG: lasso peptide biosynthesis PqqD family chaperone [Thermodesulfobacteriota bacterium]|nr:lasso peptide biosynthesis PqqD family chaperone [Thermodesulfobacteriota bacterium]